MKGQKETGPSGVTSDLLKVCESESIKKLTKVANELLEGGKLPESWKSSDLIPIYKGKMDVRSFGNYRSVKLLEHCMKVIEWEFEKRLREVVKLNEMQMGLINLRGTTDAIFVLRQVIEKYEMVGRKLYLVFVDLKMAFDRVSREVI